MTLCRTQNLAPSLIHLGLLMMTERIIWIAAWELGQCPTGAWQAVNQLLQLQRLSLSRAWVASRHQVNRFKHLRRCICQLHVAKLSWSCAAMWLVWQGVSQQHQQRFWQLHLFHSKAWILSRHQLSTLKQMTLGGCLLHIVVMQRACMIDALRLPTWSRVAC